MRSSLVVIYNFRFWLLQNKANHRNIKKIEIDGKKVDRYFTYNSAKALAEIFPYLNPKQIYRIMESLEKQDVLIKANFNSNTYNRVNWYCFRDQKRFLENGISISRKQEMEVFEKEIQFPKSGNHDTDNKPDINTDNKPETFNPETFTTKLISETKANEPITSLSFLALKERLKQIDTKFGLSYLESSKANQMYEQAAKKYGKGFDEFFLSIIEKLEKLTTKQLDKFKFSQGFTIQSLTRFDLQDCSKVEAWYNSEFPHKQTKSQNKPLDNLQDDDIFIRAIPTLEQLERMYK